MRDLYLVALVLLAGFAGTAVQSESGRSSPASKTTRSLSKQGSVQPAGPLTLICAQVVDKKCEVRPEFGTAPVRVMIAFVPDPERTNLRLYFDRAMEAMSNAAQDTGQYTLFKYSLPWQATPPAAAVSLADQAKVEEQGREMRSYPGILAFRSTFGGPALAILLVGESPTEGYRTAQLANALAFEKQLADGSDPLLLMGPSFSGTLDMLGRAIQTDQDLHSRNLKLFSGTASTGEAWNAFRSGLKPQKVELEAASFIGSNEVTCWALNDFLKQDLGFNQSPLSLSEGGTVFGGDFRAADVSKKYARRDDCHKEGGPVGFRFPRGLSHVRQAFQNQPSSSRKMSTEDAEDSILDPTQDRPTLTIAGDSSEGRDQIPEFAADTPVSHNAELSAMSDALQHEQLQYASVVATDTLDLLFVANYLRTTVPDTRLVLMDSDVLQIVPSTDISLQGSLVIGLYPIYAESQHWIGRQPRVFSSQFEEGVYGATVALASQASQATNVNLAELRGDVIAREKDAEGRDQSVFWISAIGKDALWPIALRFHADGLLRPGAEALQQFVPTFAPRYWITLAMALLVAIVALFVAYFVAQKGGETPYQWCADFTLHSSRGNLPGRAFYLSGIVMATCSLWLSVTSCQIGFFLDNPTVRSFFHGLVPALVALALAGFATFLSVRALREFHASELKSSVAYVTMFNLPWVIFVSYLAGLAVVLWPRPTEEGFFFSLRALELGSGVCPALPFLFVSLAFLLFSWTQLQRVIFCEERYSAPPDLAKDGPVGAIDNLVGDLNNTLGRPLLEQPHTALLASVAAFAFTFLFGVRCLRSLEGTAFDLAFTLAVASLSFGLVLVVVRFWNSWRRLRALLEQLELHPIRDAFTHLPEDCTWSPIWQQSPRKRNYLLLARSIESLEGIAKLPGVPDFKLDIIRDCARELLDCEAQGSRENLDTYRAMQDELTAAGQALTPTAGVDSPPEVDTFFALRFLSYIRYVMLHLRNLASFVTFGYVLLTLALGSYPFLAPRAIAWFLSLLFIGLGIPVVMVFLEMSRNAILNRMTERGKEGKSDWGFATRTISFAALPVLSMMGSHFPFISRYVFSWLQPALKSLH
jgi:hypothetical protein